MPKPDEILFALKTFAGAMLALFIALWLGLDNPYWSMATAYIVAQPLAGAMRAKGVYRLAGTLAGGTAAVVLVPNLVDAPVLLCLALALWVGLCLYLSLLDRSPRAYAFMLAGYTAGIIGFPSVTAPALIFQTALTRVEEIAIGIGCTMLIGTIVFPRPLGPVLSRRIATWVRPAIDWARAALAGHRDGEVINAARRRLAIEASDVAMMISQLSYDTSPLRASAGHVARLRRYTLSLMPVLSSVSDRVAQLRALDALTPELTSVLASVDEWVTAGGPENADAVNAQIAGLTANDPESDRTWPGMLRASLCLRLQEMVSLIRHARAIRRHVVEGDAAPANRLVEGSFVAAAVQIHDHGLALLSAAAAILATLLVCAFWITTAWTAGAGAAVIVAVACSFFAAQDDPAPAIALMIRDAVIVTIAAGAYLFLILPVVESFLELVLVLLPAGLIIGVLVSRPASFGTGMVMGAFGATDLALGNGYHGDFAGYVNSAFALVFGLAAALIVTRLLRSVGAEWSAARLMRAGWRDVAAAAAAQGAHERATLTGIMMDRLGLMMPRLAAAAPGADQAGAAMLTDLRVGLNAIGLQRQAGQLPAALGQEIGTILAQVAAFYRGNPRAPAPPALLRALDHALMLTAGAPSRARTEALMLLSGLRSVLFPNSAPPELYELAA
jgi:uncharacterized membrane protein YccC